MTLRFLYRIGRLGMTPGDDVELQLQKSILLTAILFGGIPTQLVIGILSLCFHEYPLAISLLCFATLSLVGLLHFITTHRYYRFFKWTQLAIPLLSPCVGTLLAGGLINTAFSLLWGLLAPLLALVAYSPRQALYWLVAFLLAIAFCTIAEPFLYRDNHFPVNIITVVSFANLTGISCLVFLALALFIQQRNLAFDLLRAEKEKTEALLLNILPREIADLLKQSNRVIANQFDGVSILFADLVGFTEMAADMPPVDLVQVLNEIFTFCDSLVEKYDLEKIKTIGDCYMAASGVPRPTADHAHRLVRMALDLRAYMIRNSFRGRSLHVRIGICSGPVVAGVIGRKKFTYDLWGDAVNTASRMESHGQVNEIQIPRETYELIKNDFVCQPRGTIEVKGIGPLEVWQVEAERTSR